MADSVYAHKLRALKVGDSIFIDAKTVGGWFQSEARKRVRNLGMKLSIYLRTENGVRGFRIWRNE